MQSLQVWDIGCNASIYLRLIRNRLPLTHLLEVNISYTYNHIINSAESLSFQNINEKVHEELLSLFKDEHSPSSALYVYQDNFHLKANNEQELIEFLADRSVNPDYNYTANLF